MSGFVDYKRHVRTLSHHRPRCLTHLCRALVFENSLNLTRLSDARRRNPRGNDLKTRSETAARCSCDSTTPVTRNNNKKKKNNQSKTQAWQPHFHRCIVGAVVRHVDETALKPRSLNYNSQGKARGAEVAVDVIWCFSSFFLSPGVQAGKAIGCQTLLWGLASGIGQIVSAMRKTTIQSNIHVQRGAEGHHPHFTFRFDCK